MITTYGIILKINQANNELSVLTPDFGKIILIDYQSHRSVRNKRLTSGLLLFMALERKRSQFILRDIESQTHIDHAHDLYWTHHLLELSYYFVPQGKPCPDLFKQLSLLLFTSLCSRDGWERVKRLSYFINLLGGVVPEKIEEIIDNALLKNETETRYLYERKLVEAWIVQFIQKHPYYNSLKTVEFLPQLYPYYYESTRK